MTQGDCELLWIKNILDNLRIKYVVPVKLLCDNKFANDIVHNLVQHKNKRHRDRATFHRGEVGYCSNPHNIYSFWILVGRCVN